VESKKTESTRVNPRKTIVAILATLSASLALAEDFKTIAGKEYKNATVSHIEPDGIVVKNKSGIAKIYQLQFERNYGEAVRLLQGRLAQFHYNSDYEKTDLQLRLAWAQRLAGDTAGAKVTAEEARNTLEPLYKNQSDDFMVAGSLSNAYAAIGEKDLAIKEAERAVMLRPRAQDAIAGPGFEENLAEIQAMFGENSRAISTLSQLLQTSFEGPYGPVPITPALLRLDPIWDPLRGDPRFRKLCEEKQP
jgi:tetratricopeptide (TPR) repeat protein